MNPTNATSLCHICLVVWSGYIGSNDKSTWPPPNASGLAPTTASPSRGDTDSTGSAKGGDSGASRTTGDSDTSDTWIGETYRMREDEGSDAPIGETCLLREKIDGETWGETRSPEVDGSACQRDQEPLKPTDSFSTILMCGVQPSCPQYILSITHYAYKLKKSRQLVQANNTTSKKIKK